MSQTNILSITLRILADAGRQRAIAELHRDGALAEIARLATLAKDEGASVAEIARAAGVTRVTVYAMLKKNII